LGQRRIGGSQVNTDSISFQWFHFPALMLALS
jgi:hypothetical protein